MIALGVSTLLALLLAQWTLRPVHVLKSGLTRLGHGEFDVKLDLPPGDEFSELGKSFNQLSAELSAVRSQLATGQAAPLESVVDRLEDAVAMVNPDGQVVFANAAIRTALPEASPGSRMTAWPELHRLPATGRARALDAAIAGAGRIRWCWCRVRPARPSSG